MINSDDYANENKTKHNQNTNNRRFRIWKCTIDFNRKLTRH